MTEADLDTLLRLGLALAIGLLVGIERGFSQRAEPEGSRVAGFRTFGVIGLSGGLVAVLAQETDLLLLAAAVPSFVALVLFAFWRGERDSADRGATTLFATLATFALSIIAVLGEMEHAAAGAVVLTIVLGLKREMHVGLERLRRVELRAAVQLLLISVVILPVLPDRGFGPFEAINPFRTWLMVGTGRLYTNLDKESTAQQTLYGFIDPFASPGTPPAPPLDHTDFEDVTDAVTLTNGAVDLDGDGTQDTTYEAFVNTVAASGGWFLDYELGAAVADRIRHHVVVLPMHLQDLDLSIGRARLGR